MRAWDDLTITEKQGLSLASDEAMLWEVSAAIAADPDNKRLDEIQEAQRVVRGLVDEGLVWFSVLEPGVPDLSRAELHEVFATPDWWVHDERGRVLNVRIHLTAAGERCYYGTQGRRASDALDPDGT